MVAQLTVYFTYIIEQLGYWGAAFLMALESMIAPVPSELVMPFVGFFGGGRKVFHTNSDHIHFSRFTDRFADIVLYGAVGRATSSPESWTISFS